MIMKERYVIDMGNKKETDIVKDRQKSNDKLDMQRVRQNEPKSESERSREREREREQVLRRLV